MRLDFDPSFDKCPCVFIAPPSNRKLSKEEIAEWERVGKLTCLGCEIFRQIAASDKDNKLLQK